MSKLRQRLILVLILVGIIGYGTKHFCGHGHVFVNNSLGGLVYVVFWILFFKLIFNKERDVVIGFWVFLVTSILEFTQLIKWSVLEEIRSTFLGASLIGSSFNPYDFLYYMAGFLVGLLILRILGKK